MERIKVALMSHPMDNRKGKGTALYTRKLVEALLKDERLDITLVHYDAVDDPLYKSAREIIIPRIPRLPFGTRFVRTMLFFWKYRTEKFDIIHWFQPRLYPFFWLAPARFTVVTAHGGADVTAPGQFPFSRRAYNFIMRNFHSRMAGVIGDSDFARREIIEAYGVPAEKVHTTYLGGGEDFRPLEKQEAQRLVRERYNIRTPFILDVSRLEPHKNVDTLIRAYEVMRRSSALTQSLVIVGAKRFGAEGTLALAEKSPYTADIQFLDFVEQQDLNALYAAADLFAFPSLNEGFGLPIVEALAAGVPIVTSSVTALPEIAGGCALTVDPTDAGALAEAMQKLLSDEALRRTFVEQGLVRARQFTWETTARETVDLYASLTSQDMPN